MPLEHVRIDAVRCLQGVRLDLHEKRNYLWGANGAGKTSCLEAIYLLSRGRSFRIRQTAKLLRHGASSLSVFGTVSAARGQRHRLGVEFREGHLKSQIDGSVVRSQAEMLRILPVHVLDPRLHQLVEAGPSERRRYIDGGVFHVEHDFLAHWRHYRRVLGQRNAALKAGVPDRELDIWTEPFVQAAEKVHKAREGYVQALAQAVSGIARSLLGNEIFLGYRCGWRKGEALQDVLSENRAGDRAQGFTQAGPHRADLRLRFDSGGIRETASRGQQKLVAAALVVAQVQLFEQRTGQASTILVDDASAELDDDAQARLRAVLDGLDSQQILTGLSVRALEPEPGFPLFHVEQGRVRLVV